MLAFSSDWADTLYMDKRTAAAIKESVYSTQNIHGQRIKLHTLYYAAEGHGLTHIADALRHLAVNGVRYSNQDFDIMTAAYTELRLAGISV